jgi:hypothetical protein
MDKILEMENIENFQKAEITMNYFYIFINFLIFIIISIIIKSKYKATLLTKYTYFLILIIDIIFMITYIKTYYYIDSISKELIIIFLSSSNFYITLSFLEQIYNNLLSSEDEEKNNENLNKFQISIIFFFTFFSYDKFVHGFAKLVCLIEYLAILGGIFKLYPYLRTQILEIKFILSKKNPKNVYCYNFIQNNQFLCFNIITLNYILKIAILFFDNTIIFIYSNIILVTVNGLYKYILFSLLGVILYSLNKIDFENKIPSEDIVKVNEI